MDTSNRVPTGIGAIDKNIGGFYRGRTYLVSGDAGTGKSVFAIQYLHEALLREKTAILVTNEKPEDVLLIADNLGFRLTDFLKNSRLIILKCVFRASASLDQKEDISSLVGDVERYAVKNDSEILVIDSAIPLLQLFPEEWLKEGIALFVKGLENLKLTTLMTTRMPVGRKSLLVRNSLEEAVAGSIYLDQESKEGCDVIRRITIGRLKDPAFSYPGYEFKIEPGKGIVVTSGHMPEKSVPPERPSSEENKGFSFAEEYPF